MLTSKHLNRNADFHAWLRLLLASDTVTTARELFELHLDVAPHGHEEVLDMVPGKGRVQSLLVLPVLNLDKSIRAKYS